jgi:hypothetical protein
LRVTGSGRWVRNEFGKWELLQPGLKLESFVILRDEELTETVARLRQIKGSNWALEKDPLKVLSKIRDGSEGVH